MCVTSVSPLEIGFCFLFLYFFRRILFAFVVRSWRALYAVACYKLISLDRETNNCEFIFTGFLNKRNDDWSR